MSVDPFLRLHELGTLRPHEVAVSDEHAVATYEELADRARRWAEAFEAIPKRPLTVGLALPGGVDFTACVLGAWRARVVLALLPTNCTNWEMRNLASTIQLDGLLACAEVAATTDFGPDCFVAVVPSGEHGVPELPTKIRTRATPLDEDCWQIQFTGGSTGKPKPVVLGRAALRHALQNSLQLTDQVVAPTLCVTPQFHAMGNALVLERLVAGSSLHVTNRFAPLEHQERARRHGVQTICATASYFRLLRSLQVLDEQSYGNIREVVLGAEPVDSQLLSEVLEAWPGAHVRIRYGLTETVGAVTDRVVDFSQRGSPEFWVGTALPGIELRIDSTHDDPLLAVRGPTLARGVWQGSGLEPLVDSQGWLLTSDCAEMSSDGSVRLRGRVNSLLKRHGHRLDPSEIESALRNLPGVSDALVAGTPALGEEEERILAGVVFSSGYERPLDGLKRELRALLSNHKIPDIVLALDSIPRTHAGKPSRAELVHHYRRRSAEPMHRSLRQRS